MFSITLDLYDNDKLITRHDIVLASAVTRVSTVREREVQEAYKSLANAFSLIDSLNQEKNQ